VKRYKKGESERRVGGDITICSNKDTQKRSGAHLISNIAMRAVSFFILFAYL